VSLSPEHRQPVEINVVLTQAYAQTFIHRHDCYAFQRADGKYNTRYQPLTTNHLINHLQGKITLGAYALDAESHAHWLCLDADADEAWEKLVELARTLVAREITPDIETSRRRGHLWLFTPLLSGVTMRQFRYTSYMSWWPYSDNH
jgi:hypothetical protein